MVCLVLVRLKWLGAELARAGFSDSGAKKHSYRDDRITGSGLVPFLQKVCLLSPRRTQFSKVCH